MNFSCRAPGSLAHDTLGFIFCLFVFAYFWELISTNAFMTEISRIRGYGDIATTKPDLAGNTNAHITRLPNKPDKSQSDSTLPACSCVSYSAMCCSSTFAFHYERVKRDEKSFQRKGQRRSAKGLRWEMTRQTEKSCCEKYKVQQTKSGTSLQSDRVGKKILNNHRLKIFYNPYQHSNHTQWRSQRMHVSLLYSGPCSTNSSQSSMWWRVRHEAFVPFHSSSSLFTTVTE